MKKISVVVPCYNEEENVAPLCSAVVAELKKMPRYDYEIIFIDNCSQDTTKEKIRELCKENKKIKAILNVKNFGQFNSPYYALCQSAGDCTISLCCDFQDPPEMIPRLVEEWEKGYKIVCAVKTSSREGRMMYALRSAYYKIIKRFSRIEQIEHFTGFGLYDSSFTQLLRRLDDPTPFLRGIVAELGGRIKTLEYEQAARRAGKSSNNFARLYDAALLSFTSYTKIGVRLATLLGVLMCASSALAALICAIAYVQNKAVFSTPWVIPIALTVTLVGGVILFFVGIVGEYVVSINTRIMHRPLVVEDERINFD